MPKTGQDATIYSGEDVTLRVSMSPPQSISGWSLRYVVGNEIDKAAVIVDAGAGVFQVALTDDDTAALEQREYSHAFWRTDADNERPLAIGKLLVRDGVRE